MRKIKVLLVDDEEEFVKTMSERMGLQDLDADIALNGEQALQAIEDDTPDVIVLDLKMPGMDGMEVLRRVKKAYPDVEVIMLTGHGSEKDEEEARRLGAYEYLQKPSGIDKIVQTIKSALKKFDDAMVAATFAEADDFNHAKEILEKEDEEDREDKKD